ncbi:MAG TPA: PIN domain-containing protein [Candidatus Contendobacter sp.]|nr:PIN domain-containing protein [Candidatus Contendobacter sp.]
MSLVLFDTSVLVPCCIATHAHRARAWAIVAESAKSGMDRCISLHSLAETFAVLSALPINPRISADQAIFLIEKEILQNFLTVPLSVGDYRQAMSDVARAGRSGGAIYDALILQAARNVGASKLYTFNDKHFQSLLREGEPLQIICP